MAANDYYNSSPSSGRPKVNCDAPLPPLPPAVPAKTSDPTAFSSPFTTPFDDNVYPTQSYDSNYGHIPDYSYDGGETGSAHGPNPSADYIPLTNHPSNSATPGHTPGKGRPLYNSRLKGGIADDGGPEGRRRRKRRHKDFDAGRRTPWFVYFMTLIQVTVFLVEIIRNCGFYHIFSPYY